MSIDELSAAVGELFDREAIRELKARYFRCLDAKDWTGLRDVFTDDLHFESEPYAMDGGDEFVEFLRVALADSTTVHHGHMPEIEINPGGRTARGTWAMFDFVEVTQAEAVGAGGGIKGYGHYRERYRKEGNEWRISELVLKRIRVDPLVGGEVSLDHIEGYRKE